MGHIFDILKLAKYRGKKGVSGVSSEKKPDLTSTYNERDEIDGYPDFPRKTVKANNQALYLDGLPL